uniref:Putative ovule protein n=1 Tax=Solanum chacoense TaxID=4108 RepID=A0A0V0INE9_SOLCH
MKSRTFLIVNIVTYVGLFLYVCARFESYIYIYLVNIIVSQGSNLKSVQPELLMLEYFCESSCYFSIV